jgi:LysR family hydrogen peroxide-inducible transcriptional activator
MGITLMPQLAIPLRPTETNEIRYLPFTDPKPSRQIGMLYRQGSYREETFIKLRQLIQTEMNEKEIRTNK